MYYVGDPPGSLHSETWMALPPKKPTTCLAASISPSLAPIPRHTDRAFEDFSTNTSLVFRLEAEASTWTWRQVRNMRKSGFSTPPVHTHMFCRPPHLHSSGGAGRTLADVEEASAASLWLSTFARCSSTMDHHGFALEEAHQVGRFLTLSHSHLWMDGAKSLITRGGTWFTYSSLNRVTQNQATEYRIK